jgi:hypothetical protein
MGKNVVDALGLASEAERSPIEIALEYGVRRLDQPLALRSRAGLTKLVTADVFPAYDEDGGLLVALTPRAR